MAGAGKEMARRAQARAHAEVPAAKSLSKNVGRMLRGALFGRHTSAASTDTQARQQHATSTGSAASAASVGSAVSADSSRNGLFDHAASSGVGESGFEMQERERRMSKRLIMMMMSVNWLMEMVVLVMMMLD